MKRILRTKGREEKQGKIGERGDFDAKKEGGERITGKSPAFLVKQKNFNPNRQRRGGGGKQSGVSKRLGLD